MTKVVFVFWEVFDCLAFIARNPVATQGIKVPFHRETRLLWFEIKRV